MQAPAAVRLMAALFAIAIAMPLVPYAGGAPEEAPSPAIGTYYVVDIPAARSGELLAKGLDLVETYDTFALVRDTRGVMGSLQATGLSAASAEELFTVQLNGYAFDVRQRAPDLPDALRIAYGPREEGAHLVHFLGPMKESWVWEVERLGGVVERYLGGSAVLVRMTPEVAEQVRGLGRVDYVDALHPAYRIEPGLLQATGTVEVKIITFAGESVNPVLAFLGRNGIARTGSAADLRTLSFAENEDFGVVKARVPASLLPAIAALRGVEYIEPIYPTRVANVDMQWIHQSDVTNTRTEWTNGLNGTGQIIAIADSGIDFDHEQVRESDGVIQLGGLSGPNSFYNATDYNRRKVIRYLPMSVITDNKLWYGPGGDPNAAKDSPLDGAFSGCRSGHGTAVTSVAAGNDDPITIMSPGNNDGIAKGAKVFFEDIGTEGPSSRCTAPTNIDILLSYIPDDYEDMFQPAYDAGARIHTNSWGSGNSDYDLEARMVDQYMWAHKDFLVIFSAGNDGPSLGTVGSPSVNKDGMSIAWSGNANTCGGGANTQNDLSAGSSRGFTQDGRLKPDIAATGEGNSARTSGNPGDSVATTDWCWTGTSYAGPAAAGGAAIVRQYLTEGWWPTGGAVPGNGFTPSAALIKSLLMAGARKMTGAGTSTSTCGAFTYPNCGEGFGRYTLDDSLYLTGDAKDTWFHDYTTGLTTGQTWTTRFWVNSNAQGLRVVLTYTDYPGAVAANPALVNNLNLVITSPDGLSAYKGSCYGTTFANSDSRANTCTADVLNAAEGVVLSSGSAAIQSGAWTLSVTAANVPVGPQPFAVSVIGDLDLAFGHVALDRPEYTEGETPLIRVVDTDAPAGTISVTAVSDTESVPETFTLTEIADGIYTGSLPVAFGPLAADGVLQVSNGDTITVSYDDAGPVVQTAVATATIEAIYPIITNVVAKDISNSAATITWNTDIPANSTVYYGTTPALGLSAQADHGWELRVAHAVSVSNLATDTVYYFDVCSTDRQGHTSCDSAGGNHYSFRTSLYGEVLLVIGDGSFSPDRLAMYRAALADRKWSLNEWDILTQGMPTLALLRDYKAVIWQVGTEQYPPFEPAAMNLINDPLSTDDLLDGGGRILFTGHDIAWAFCDTTNSEWGSTANCNWVRATLKANYQNDPSIVTQLTGYSGDPISGNYLAGVCYSRHRDGGSMDEINEEFAADTFYVWRSTTPDDVAVRWLSPSANGTGLPGSWTWKGTRSKVVSFFFEYTGINWNGGPNPCADSPANRADILNKTVTWLIGDGVASRDHPWVAVSSPNGGESYTTSPITVSWSKSVGGGLSIASQALYYSPNSGQNWILVSDTIPGADTSFSWDVSALPNGKNYMVRIVALDNGSVPLSGADDSDGTFTINRPGGDTQPPLAHIPRPDPHPATTGQAVTFTATVDDTQTGNSDVHGTLPAEYQINSLGWITMSLASAPTSPLEDVVWTGTLSSSVPAGWNTLCVRGRDAPGNLGVPECVPFYVILGGPAPPGPPRAVHAALAAPGFQDVTVTWNPSLAEGTAEFDHYEVHRGTAYDPSGASYTVLPAATNLPAGTASFTDGTWVPGQTHFYVVKAVGIGGASNGDYQVAKVVRAVAAGSRLFSLPLQVQDASVGTVLQTVAYASVRYYDVTDPADPWKAYYGPGRGDFTAVDYRYAFWIDVTSGGEWRVAGRVPTTTSTDLVAGWNFVGYASFVPRTASVAFVGLSVMRIEAYDATASPYYVRLASMGEMMAPSEGYWVYATAPGTWIVTN